MTGEAKHVLDRVTKRYSRLGPKVIDDVTFNIAAGSHTLIVGTNGSGKSTLLSTMARTTRQTSGTVSTPGPIGFTPERLPAHLRFTASEYLQHMGRIRGLAGNDVRTRANDLFERLALVPGPGVPFESLSKGNRQKVMLAQAFLGNTATVILDEPASGLDRTAAEALGELVSEVRNLGASVISSAQELAWWAEPDEVLRIWSGRLHPELSGESPDRTSQVLRLVAISPGDFDVSVVTRFEGTRVEAIRAGGMVEIVTNDRVVDALLSDLLAHGWSIRSLVPTETIGDDQTP